MAVNNPSSYFAETVHQIVMANSAFRVALDPIYRANELQRSSRKWIECQRLAKIAASDGNLLKAESLWRDALDCSKIFDIADLRVAITLDALVNVCCMRRRFVQARTFLKRALDNAELCHGFGSPIVGIYLNDYAGLLYEDRRNLEAEPYALRALTILSSTYGARHDLIGSVHCNIGSLSLAQGNFHQAKMHFQAAISIKHTSASEQEVLHLLRTYTSLLFTSNRDPRNTAERRPWRYLRVNAD